MVTGECPMMSCNDTVYNHGLAVHILLTRSWTGEHLALKFSLSGQRPAVESPLNGFISGSTGDLCVLCFVAVKDTDHPKRSAGIAECILC